MREMSGVDGAGQSPEPTRAARLSSSGRRVAPNRTGRSADLAHIQVSAERSPERQLSPAGRGISNQAGAWE